jgi:AbrB family looped-hinge helix DNA binding protein
MTVAKVGKAGQMTIPAQVRKALGIEQGDSVRFVEIAPGKFSIARATVKDLRGMFGPARRRASIEEMNAAIAEYVIEDYARSTNSQAVPQKRSRSATKAAASTVMVSKCTVDGYAVYGSPLTPEHLTQVEIVEAVAFVRGKKSGANKTHES